MQHTHSVYSRPLCLGGIILSVAFLVGCAGPSLQKQNTITQISTVAAVRSQSPIAAAGTVKPGHTVTTVAQLKKYGDTGSGILQSPNSRMILLDGDAYKVRPDGSIRMADPVETVEFALMTPFTMTIWINYADAQTKASLLNIIDTQVPDKNEPVFAKIVGEFGQIQLIPEHNRFQEPATGTRGITFKNVRGTLLAVRIPPSFSGLYPEGWHLSFISADKKTGGGVQSFETSSGDIYIDARHFAYHVILP